MVNSKNNIGVAFLEHSLINPSGTCIVDGEISISRNDLACWAISVANVIKNKSNGVDVAVILIPRSWAVPAAMIAVRLAGLAFLPLDIRTPIERIQHILAKVKPRYLITFKNNKILRDAVMEDTAQESTFIIPAAGQFSEQLHITALMDYAKVHADTGHIIFTSGSTGNPKGVLLRDSPLMKTTTVQRMWSGAGENTRPSLWALSPGFDASLSDIFCALLGSSPLAVFRPEQSRWKTLRRFMSIHGVGYADIAPSLMRILKPEDFNLCCLIFGGERCDPKTARIWGQHGLALQAYGPTETAVCAMMARAGDDWKPGLLGRPLPCHIVTLSTPNGCFDVIPENLDAKPLCPDFNRVLLRDSITGELFHEGIIEGEILISGQSVAIGYLNDHLSTAFTELNGVRTHRTGDIACFEDGFLIWKGRNDRRFKRNGYMVCPEEIERVVNDFTGKLCAFIIKEHVTTLAVEGVVSPETETMIFSEIKSQLGQHFLPNRIESIPEWPFLDNMKTDMKTLQFKVGAKT